MWITGGAFLEFGLHGVGERGNHSTDSVLSLLDAGVDFSPEEVGFLGGESGNASLQHCINFNYFEI